jgi:hypothetical protein
MKTPLPDQIGKNPPQVGLYSETIETLQIAIRALSNPDARIWPALLQLLCFTRRLETMQNFEELTPAQQTVQMLRISEENELLHKELQQLVGKLAARWVSRACRSEQLAEEQFELDSPPAGFGPFDPESEPWLAAMISKSMIE